MADDDTIVDAERVALGGAGAGNGSYTSGEVYAVNFISVRANDAAAAEPASGQAPMLFTVTLDSAAPAGGLSLDYATADGTATGGASCDGTADYLTTGGTLSFSAGERVKTVAVNVCADGAGSETNETLLLNISGASLGSIDDAQAAGIITQGGTTAGTFIISELRTSGPGGTADEFVEFYNNTNLPHTVAASDASAGYGIFKMGATCADTPVLVGTIPNGTVIPARGHYLAVGSGYTLGGYAAGDLTLTADIESDANVGVFTTANVSNLSTVTRLDAVGFGSNVDPSAAVAFGGDAASRPVRNGVQPFRKGVKADVLSAGGSNGVCDLLREGNNLPTVSGSNKEYSFFREECDFTGGVGCATGGNPKDTGDNAADFMFADTAATLISGVQRRLGAPGPENLSSPVRRDNSGVGAALLDGTVSSSVPPNRVRGFASDPTNNSTFGTLTIRRRVFNHTGGDVTRLRFRIIEMTTYPVPAGTADLRARTSVDEVSVGPINDAVTCAAAGAGSTPCTLTVKGLTLEEPPSQPDGGGVNATLAAGTVTLAQPLTDGASLPVSFLLGLQATGTFRFYIIVEALP